MTYRNTASEILSISTSVLEAGVKTGKKVWLAVETTDVVDEDIISYFGMAYSTLMADLKIVEKTASGYARFAGVGIHDYNGLLGLK